MDNGSDPLRICMLSDDFVPAATGVGTHLQAVVAALTSRHHQVLVITTRRPGQPAADTWRGARVLRTTTLRMFGFYQALPSRRWLHAALEEFGPDIVHHHYLGVLFLRGLFAAERLRIPQVYTYHMTEDHLTQPALLRPLRPLIASQIRRHCNRVDRIVSVSANLAHALREGGLQPPVHYITNPVGFPTAPPTFARPPGPPVVLFVGRLNPEKNVPLLLKAFAQVRATVEARLHVVGDGSDRAALERLARELGISADVRFLGFIEHASLPPYFLGSDIFVLPSKVETQGLVALEAMHFRKPVLVARSVVSADELVEPGTNGYIVDDDDPGDLAARLLELIRNPELAQRLGTAGGDRASRYRPEVVVPQLEDLYHELAGGGAGTA